MQHWSELAESSHESAEPKLELTVHWLGLVVEAYCQTCTVVTPQPKHQFLRYDNAYTIKPQSLTTEYHSYDIPNHTRSTSKHLIIQDSTQPHHGKFRKAASTRSKIKQNSTGSGFLNRSSDTKM